MSGFSTSFIPGKTLPVVRENHRATLLGLNTARLREVAQTFGQPAYRGTQLARWLYKARVAGFDDMTDLPAGFRASLAEHYDIGAPKVLSQREAPDRTTKLLLGMGENRVETVLLPYDDRVSVCVSSQAGCAAGCVFCATAALGLSRSLTAGEIVGQVLAAANALESARWWTGSRDSARPISHVVYMGMGEPLWNLDNVLESIHLLNEEMGIGMRGITISTVGIPDGIRRLAAEKLQVTLAVSLHAGTEDTRRRLVPVARRYPFTEVLEAAEEYFARTGRRVSYEYVLLGGVNDTRAEAEALASRLRGGPSHVNLIPWNPASSKEAFRASSRSDVTAFRGILEQAGIAVTVRRERGQGIDAACGQLAAGSRDDD